MKNGMLKVLVCLVLITATLENVAAQTKDKTWSIGPEVGANFSKYGKDADDSDYKTGLLAGGFVTYSIRNTHAFTAKVLFSQKGAKSDNPDVKQHLNYIEVPIVARIFFNREGDIRPNIFAGPSFGFLNGVKQKTGDGDYETVDNYEDSFETFDIGLGLGLGLNIRVAEEMYFIIDTRYTFGFTDITKASGDVNNQAVAVSAGLSFGIGN